MVLYFKHGEGPLPPKTWYVANLSGALRREVHHHSVTGGAAKGVYFSLWQRTAQAAHGAASNHMWLAPGVPLSFDQF